jgi:hypothetical protein
MMTEPDSESNPAPDHRRVAPAAPDHAELSAALERHARDNPSGGDCHPTALRVTEALHERGFEASTARIAGWEDTSARILGFFHEVTLCGDIVLDGTARQFDPTLPAAWISPLPQYLRRLAHATGISHATVWPDRTPARNNIEHGRARAETVCDDRTG